MRKAVATRWWVWFVAGLFAVAAVAGACGDNDGGGDTPTPTATATASPTGDNEEPTPTSAATDSPEPSPSPAATSGNGEASTLREMLDSYGEATGVVVYHVSDDSGTENTWAIYSDPPSLRVDIDTGTNVISSYETPGASFYCTSNDESCVDAQMFSPTRLFFAAFDIFVTQQTLVTYTEDLGEIATSEREIAGVEATCYSAEGTFAEDSGEATWCFREDGLLLLADYDLTGTSWRMEATEVREDVPANAFDAPYPVEGS